MADLDVKEPRMIKIIPMACHSVISIYYTYYCSSGAPESMLKFCNSIKEFLTYHGDKVIPINRSIVHTAILWISKNHDPEYCKFASKDISTIMNSINAIDEVFPLSTLQYTSKDIITDELKASIQGLFLKMKNLSEKLGDKSNPRIGPTLIYYLRALIMTGTLDNIPAELYNSLIPKFLSMQESRLSENRQVTTSLYLALTSLKAIDSQ